MDDTLLTDLAALTGDLSTNVQGDLDTVSGIDNLTAALQRRFETPLGALFYDSTYGNPLFNRLSSPMGRDFERAAVADATACILCDPRVQRADVSLKVDREARSLLFHIEFVAKDGTSGSFDKGVSMRV